MLSEYTSFPVNPHASNLENCLSAVRDHADLFVLICGSRYGSTTEDGPSITNLEYLEAVTKGIPTYVFVKKSVLDVLPVWKDNPEANFSSSVDSPKLLEFVGKLREGGQQWVFPFERAEEIQTTLRHQFGLLFGAALRDHERLRDSSATSYLNTLNGEALRIALQKPRLWEYLLFGVVAKEDVERHRGLRYDLRHGLGTGKPLRIRPRELLDWYRSKLDELDKLGGDLNRLVNVAFPEATGAHGEPGDAQLIVRTARQLGNLYKRFLYSSLEWHDLTLGPEFRKLIEAGSNCGMENLGYIESFVEDYLARVTAFLKEAPRSDGAQTVLTFTVKLGFSGDHATVVHEEIERLIAEGEIDLA